MVDNERLVALEQTLFSRRSEMPEGSSTVELLRSGPPKILEKCTEEMGEVFQALLEQDDDQVNLEISQAIYNVMVLMAACDKGSMEGVLDVLQAKQSDSGPLPKSLGEMMRVISESTGRFYRTILSETSSDDDVNLTVADLLGNYQDAIKLTSKGSWEGVLEKI